MTETSPLLLQDGDPDTVYGESGRLRETETAVRVVRLKPNSKLKGISETTSCLLYDWSIIVSYGDSSEWSVIGLLWFKGLTVSTVDLRSDS